MKKYTALLIAVLLTISTATHALSPPLIRKTLAERVALSSHIIIATAKDVRVVKTVDGQTVYVEPTPNQLDLETGTEIQLHVDKGLYPANALENQTIKYRFGGGLFDVLRIKNDLVGLQKIFLLVEYEAGGQTLYGQSYGWHLCEPIDSLPEILRYIHDAKRQ